MPFYTTVAFCAAFRTAGEPDASNGISSRVSGTGAFPLLLTILKDNFFESIPACRLVHIL